MYLGAHRKSITRILYAGLRWYIQHIYTQMVLFMVSIPEPLEEHTCAEPLLLDLWRLRYLQTAYDEMLNLVERCVCVHKRRDHTVAHLDASGATQTTKPPRRTSPCTSARYVLSFARFTQY